MESHDQGTTSHVIPAQNIASVEKAEENLKKACTHYKGALQMMRQPEMENNNQDIKVLKDYGVCLMKKGNYLEA